MRLLIMSDTHVPQRAKDLPAQLWREVDAADLDVRAGDWGSERLLDRLPARSRSLLAGYGNNDGPAVRARLPEVASAEVARLRLTVVHETGLASGREQRCESDFADTDVLVFGHSHIPWDSVAPGEPCLLNPGSPTDRRGQPHHTYLTASLTASTVGGELSDVRLHRLPPG